ncbi:MAG TPA: hypothetical protein VFS69_04415 [Sphingomicrobium sp.]|nr:hypothetical protein [Sphingomicrobium sp.]
MIASHYAEAALRTIGSGTMLRAAPSEQSDVIAELEAGEPFAMLDNSVGWCWGYGGGDRLVGYVRSEALAAA